MPNELVLSIDSGTSSNRILIFNTSNGNIEAKHQIEIKQHFPQSGWMEEDANEIYNSMILCINNCIDTLLKKGFSHEDVKCIGITNQRETTIVWDKNNGKPLYNAIIWSDTRTADLVKEFSSKTPNKKADGFLDLVGLPVSTYFSALKLRWLLNEVKAVKEALAEKRLMFGTVDSWLIWKLTNGQSHVTDVTNASRTMLMNLSSLKWDDKMCKFFNIDQSILPKILSSSDNFGTIQVNSVNKHLLNIPITGVLGDQQASLVGQNCIELGQTKITFGTGAFLLTNIGNKPKFSKSGLLTTVAYRLGSDKPTCYAYEGSIPVAAGAVNWLSNSLGIIESVEKDLDSVVKQCSNNGGCYFVPAFTGLLCPHWRPDARGVIVGLSQNIDRSHLCRAALESIAYQIRDIFDAINKDKGLTKITDVRIDGGMTTSPVFCGILADLCELKVSRPESVEATALGAAIAACYGKNMNPNALITSTKDTVFKGEMARDKVIEFHKQWLKAVKKTYEN